MSELFCHFEWEDPAGAKGAELRASWARLEIRANGEAVTRVHDTATAAVRDAVYLPLYPLAEWLAANWWYLKYEVEAPGLARSLTYARRHSLASAREGFALPELRIAPEGDETRLGWRRSQPAGCQVAFIAAGECRLPTAAVTAELGRLVQAVCDRLDSQGVVDTWLQREWAAITATDDEEEEYCAALAQAAVDPYGTTDALADRLLSLLTSLPEALRLDFMAITDLDALEADFATLQEAIRTVGEQVTYLGPLVTLRASLAADCGLPPWQQGYRRAVRLRQELGLDGRALPTWPDLCRALAVSDSEVAGALHVTAASFDAYVGANANGGPGFLLSKPPERTAGRFAFVRALHEYLATSDMAFDSLVSRARNARQSCSRAFAAEFLAPAEALAARLAGVAADDDSIAELAAEFGVSEYVIWHQIDNHGLSPLATTWEPSAS